ncbi:PAS domain S-box-containing protein/diguanylate cyclase (GGDEF) domain-containing protein [Actinopolyspora xinjiangensis]|uniref:PAS domain S-box-containing protein/diguanylate cyclase (GGDEF) domain-containing protein n=1 Tax=Actinopolyspora xinjiangensis TaxID=405564 RepID=A0A1H0UYR3_9ACTN|nr:bifunctional diguanylate cyclase/phosphodiesterase [Actinopolyspora xinjiangensis]SDP71215.1 PAS domain S-box-containing protein/diguanylate cyclase (GGDEF) domain-containing protein [Actinopolyspora xinjiangensis]
MTERSKQDRRLRAEPHPPEAYEPVGTGVAADLGAAVEPLPDAPALLSDPSGVVIRATDQAATLLGAARGSELTGRSLTGLLTVEDEFAKPRDRPEDVWFRVLSWSNRGNPRLTVTLLVDVSDLMTPTARTLANERRKLQNAQRVAGLGTWEGNPHTNELRLSETLLEITGTPPGTETTFEYYLGHTHPEDQPRVARSWRELTQNHIPMEVEQRYVRPDGTMRILLCHGAVITDVADRPLLVGTAQDVTEQRTAVTRMERSSQRFTDLVGVVPVGIGLFDESERLIEANDAMCELLGYPLESLRGNTIGAITHPDEGNIELAATELSDIPRGRRGEPVQRMLARSDGQPVYCELHTALSVRDDGTKSWLVVFQDVTERRRNAEALRFQATHDELTGLPNRAAVKAMLTSMLAEGDPDRIAVLFCDIDNFKRINDSLGHDAGDDLLVALARRLEGGLPDGCVAARISGDEFVVICADVHEVGGTDSLATRVSGLLRTAVPVRGQLVRVSASIGASVPDGTNDGADLLRFADAAMFEAKRGGPGRVSLAGPSLMASADSQLHLEGQLREALHHDQLTLYYQPVVDRHGLIVSAEALLRWPHQERGLLSPGVFLPVADQGGLMRDIDRWVLRNALSEAAEWPGSGDTAVSVAVNLAGMVPGDPDFVDYVTDCVRHAGISWDRVVLELVESSLVDLPARTRSGMRELVNRGARFAVDDFGTGFSSLARLKELPAQIIKVDRGFVSEIHSDSGDFAVAKAVVDMAGAMGRSCVAEGVENAQQFDTLLGAGVDKHQGWFFSPPVPAPEFHAMLAGGSLLAARGRN